MTIYKPWWILYSPGKRDEVACIFLLGGIKLTPFQIKQTFGLVRLGITKFVNIIFNVVPRKRLRKHLFVGMAATLLKQMMVIIH